MKYILMMDTMRAAHGSRVAEGGLAGARRFHEETEQGSSRYRRTSFYRGAVVSRSGQTGASGQDGVPVTDGVFPESKEFFAGFWIVDVEIPERVCVIAARASAAPGPGGAPLNISVEVRPVMSASSEEML